MQVFVVLSLWNALRLEQKEQPPQDTSHKRFVAPNSTLSWSMSKTWFNVCPEPELCAHGLEDKVMKM